MDTMYGFKPNFLALKIFVAFLLVFWLLSICVVMGMVFFLTEVDVFTVNGIRQIIIRVLPGVAAVSILFTVSSIAKWRRINNRRIVND